MDSYRNTGIKDIITTFPKVEEILGEYGIGCGECTVGICELKDILEIHKMAPEKERELMTRIEAVIYPHRQVETVTKGDNSQQENILHLFSKPMQILVDEHTLIKRWLALIPMVIDDMDLSSREGRQVIVEGVDLIQSYADKLHHGKEEDILFTYFDDSEKIFQVIYEDHKVGRHHVQQMLQALEKEDSISLSHHLSGYLTLLTEHIRKEDELLFPWLDRKLSEEQLQELAGKFEVADKATGIDSRQYLFFIEKLENKYME